MTTSVLIIAHGSRRAEANDDLHEIAAQLADSCSIERVQPAFLELAEPDIISGGQLLLSTHKPDRVVMLPYFLSAGVHVQRDLNAARTRLQDMFPDIQFQLARPIGLHAAMTSILIDRLNELEP